MAGRIAIDPERCKGCGLCGKACPRARIKMSKTSNRNGFFPAQADPLECTGCAQCAVVCPEAAITVYRESAVTEVKSGRRARKAVGVLKEKP
jgi:2-oxoglutarate ferredoxin oxidoreductase subunit delta